MLCIRHSPDLKFIESYDAVLLAQQQTKNPQRSEKWKPCAFLQFSLLYEKFPNKEERSQVGNTKVDARKHAQNTEQVVGSHHVCYRVLLSKRKTMVYVEAPIIISYSLLCIL